MTEILFYHLTASRLEDTLPILLERSLSRHWKVAIRFVTAELRDAIDQYLWVYSEESFLAHGTEHDRFASDQPILLTLDSVTNGAEVLFCVEGAPYGDVSHLARLVIMFDSNDLQQLEVARGQWKALRETNYSLTYWQQAADKRWVKKV